MSHARSTAAFVILLASACAPPISAGNVLEVGPSQRLKQPSDAARVAQAGDTIRIAPGTYTDCAIWGASSLTIAGAGPGTVLADKTCAGKAIFVIAGSDVTVRNLTFTRATVADHNGAGIRAEGRNLTVQDSRFIDNENGILAAPIPGSTIRIINSEFRGNGKCEPQCAHGIYINAVDHLIVSHSRFFDQHVGHHLKSRALHTAVIDNEIADGPDGNSSYLIDIPNGGDVLIQGNRMQKGPKSENRDTAVAIGFEGVKHPTDQIIIRDNTFTSDLPMQTSFVHNRTTTPATLSGNHLQGRVTPLLGLGTVSP